MPPILALSIYLLLIFILLSLDIRNHRKLSVSLWVPTIWMMIISSRMVSLWFKVSVFVDSPDYYLDGSPIDRTVFLVLIIFGFFILYKRRLEWSSIIHSNRWLALLVAFCFISILWSDFPMVTMKRLVKFLGSFLMVLVIFTEKEKTEAIKAVIRRTCYAAIPLSVILIKYYPVYGRSYSRWTAATVYTGVTTNKNALGVLCLVAGFYFIWTLGEDVGEYRGLYMSHLKRTIPLIYLVMIGWLLIKSRSLTPLACLISGTVVYAGTGLGMIRRNKKIIHTCVAAALVVFVFLQLTVGFFQASTQMLGKDATLTGRTQLWNELLDVKINKILGAGYYSFWLGERAEEFWNRYEWHPNQAHNGYLEVYLNLGLLGLLLLLMVIFSSYKEIVRSMEKAYFLERFNISFLFIICLYNITEATFLRATSLMWFMFLLVVLRVPNGSPPEGQPA